MMNTYAYRTPTPAPNKLGNSRRVIVEEKAVLKQALLLLGLFVLLLTLFFFIIVPFILKITAGPTQNTQNSNENVAPLAPVLSAPRTATNSAYVTLTGFNEKNATVVLLQNDSESIETKIGDDGKFSFDVTLQEGENKLQAFSFLGDGDSKLTSPKSQEYTVLYDSQPPELEIISPTEGQSIQGKKNQLLTVSGNTDLGCKVLINDRLAKVSGDGSFTFIHSLGTGENKLTLKSIDRAGNTTQKEVLVTFQE